MGAPMETISYSEMLKHCYSSKKRKQLMEQYYRSNDWKAQKVAIGFELWVSCTGQDITKEPLKLLKEYLQDGGEFKSNDRFVCRYNHGLPNGIVETIYEKTKQVVMNRVEIIRSKL